MQLLASKLIIGFNSLTLPEDITQFYKRYGFAGIILFDYDCQTKSYSRNIKSFTQLQDLCGSIKQLAGSSENCYLQSTASNTPIICIDQEGGKVRRLKHHLGFKPLRSALAANPCNEHSSAIDQVSTSAYRSELLESLREQKRLGIDVNLAPCIDLNLNPKNPDISADLRSYSSDPKKVLEFALLWCECAEKTGMGICFKHFPGLGSASVNTHHDIATVDQHHQPSELLIFHQVLNHFKSSHLKTLPQVLLPWF